VTPDTDEPNAQPSAEPSVPKPRADHQPAGSAPKPHPDSRAERAKNWADAAYALVKTILLFLAGAALIIVSTVAVWRDLRHRRITVAIDPQAEKLLLDHAIEFDLPSVLVDDVNAKITGVNEIVKSQAFENVLGTNTPDAVSFKPFGLDISTGDITGLVRNILGIPPEFVVQIGISCSPAPCAAAATPSAPRESLTLFVKSQGPTNTQSLSYPLPSAGAGLRRGLREALEQTSKTVLLQADPLLASDFFLNEPLWTIFFDKAVLDESRAAAAVFGPHPNTPDSNCLGEVIFDGSAFQRGDPQAMPDLERMDARSGLSNTCRMLVQTNLALFNVDTARCTPPERRAAGFRAANAALNSLKDIPRRAMSDQEHLRIVSIGLQSDIIQAFSSLMDDDSRDFLCWHPATTSQANVQPIDYTRIVRLIDRIPQRLPPEKDHLPIHNVVYVLSWIHGVTAAHSDLPSRYLVSRQMVRLIQLYLPTDQHPRQLFLAEGRAWTDMAAAALRAQALPDGQQRQFLQAIGWSPGRAIAPTLRYIFQSSLDSAVVAFENAAATSPMPPPLEPASAMEPQVMLGDAFYAAGNEPQAKNAYADAIRQFAQEDEPPDELLWLAKAAARWAAILSHEGNCKTSSPRIADWDNVWIPLGAAPDHDLCRFAQPGSPPSAELDKFGVMGLVYPLIAESVRQCANPDQAATGNLSTVSDRMKLLDCLHTTGPEAYVGAPPQLTAMSSEDADHKIANFLSPAPAH